jgi:hypothetical protein
MGLSVRFVSNNNHVMIAPEGAPTDGAFAHHDVGAASAAILQLDELPLDDIK